MSILIKGAKMPREGNWITVCIYPNGKCAVLNRQGGYKNINALEIPPHGRLIDADKLPLCMEDFDDRPSFRCVFDTDIEAAPTVIEAEEQEHE